MRCLSTTSHLAAIAVLFAVSYAAAVQMGTEGMSIAMRSEANPTSTNDCSINGGDYWEYRPGNVSPLVNPLQNCCAKACWALLVTIGVSPNSVTMSSCCGACNKYNCAGPSSFNTAKANLMTIINVPALQSAQVTTVSVQL
jgi:hypothetical protein